MATYNWAYKPNVPNKYGIVIPDTADDVLPYGFAYVSLFGSDELGNGSRQRPFRTIAKGASTLPPYIDGSAVILSSGVYRDLLYTAFQATVYRVIRLSIIGDGDVTIDQSYTVYDRFFDTMASIGLFNVTSIGNGSQSWSWAGNDNFNIYAIDSKFKGVAPCNKAIKSNQPGNFTNCVIEDCAAYVHLNSILNANCTYVRCSNIVGNAYGGVNIDPFNSTNMVFYQCNIKLFGSMDGTRLGFRNSIFYQCNFLFNGTDNGVVNTLAQIYPNVPSGFLRSDDIEEIKQAAIDAFPLATVKPFDRCLTVDPKFNNIVTGDYTLAFDSPAKNLSYFGTYVGAKSIGYSIKASATEVDGDFDFSTAININLIDNSITMTDNTLISVIETNCKTNLIQRQFSKVSVQGFNADRNGQYIDSIKDLSATTISAGTNLVANTPYIVEVASITYDGAVILAGERFTTNAVLSFTTAGGGICREITEAPQRHTIEARFNDGGLTKTVGDALTVGYWYYVSGTITYNGVDYTDRTFKVIDTNSFTGAGILMEALTTQAYQHYEIGIPFTSNNIGDARTGAIVRGNGDPLYERGTNKEFPINARFIQIKFTIQPNNLKP